jgi:hypothetical protein
MLTDGMHECLGSSGVPIKGDSSSDFFLGYRRNGEKKKKNSDQLIHELPRQKEKKTAEAFYYHASNEQVAVTIWFQSRI